VDSEIVPGANSQFDVLAGGLLLFSKQREGRFPEAEDIVDALA
jgi:predicted Rdx family selenoprotein